MSDSLIDGYSNMSLSSYCISTVTLAELQQQFSLMNQKLCSLQSLSTSALFGIDSSHGVTLKFKQKEVGYSSSLCATIA